VARVQTLLPDGHLYKYTSDHRGGHFREAGLEDPMPSQMGEEMGLG
jgi:hypothetical protein